MTRLFLFASLLFISHLFSQDLSYLNKVSFGLVNDMKNSTTLTFTSDVVLNKFVNETILFSIKDEKVKSEKLKELTSKLKSNYKTTLKQTKTLLEDNNFIMDEFDMWSNVPLNFETIPNQSTNSNKEDIAVLNCMFLLGDLDKRIIMDVTVLVHENNYSIVSVTKPITFFSFLMNDTYGNMYSQARKILETTLTPVSSVDKLLNGNPLVGEKHDKEWNKCSIQLFDENNPTLIKIKIDSNSFLNNSKAEIKASLFEEVTKQDGLRFMKEILGVFAQQFVIYASEENNFSSDKHIKVFTEHSLSTDKATDITTVSLELKSENKVIYTLKLKMFPNSKKVYNIDLFLIE